MSRTPNAPPSGTWVVTEFHEGSVPPGVEISLAFDNGFAMGQAPCNEYVTPAVFDGAKVRIDPALGGPATCDPERLNAEAAYLRALHLSNRFEVDGDGRLTLYSADKVMVRARR